MEARFSYVGWRPEALEVGRAGCREGELAMKQQQAVRTGWSGKEPSSRGLQRPAVKRCCFPSAFHIFRRHLWRTFTWNHRERKVGSILLLQFEYVKVGSDHCSVL